MDDISDTAYLVATYRALETKRSDALFHDPFAQRLAGGRGEVLSEVMGNKPQATNVIAVRTYVIDHLIQQLIASSNVDTVINLAAGFDTRPYRLPLPASLRWIEVDLPPVITYKEQVLEHEQPVCRLERVKCDLSDLPVRQTLFSSVNAIAQQALVITEGLLSYWSEAQVSALIADLNQQPHFRWWLLELMPSIVRQGQQHSSQNHFDQYFAGGQPTLLFAPENGVEFFQAQGWTLAEFRSLWSELRRLKRGMKAAGLVTLLMRCFANKSWRAVTQQGGVVLLERSAN